MSDNTGEPELREAEAAFYEAINELGEVISEMEPLKHQEAAIRTRIGILVAQHGALRTARAQATMTAPAVARRIDMDAFDRLVASYRAMGMDDIANDLLSIVEYSERAGSLRINWNTR